MRSRTRLAAVGLLGLATAAGGMFMPRLFSDPPQAPVATPQSPARPASAPVPFDGERAMGYLKQVCQIGPRVSGSDGMRRQQKLIEEHFTKLGAKVTPQKFPAKQTSRPAPIEMTNLIVSWHPDRERRVILCTHYDTRPIADQEPDRRNWEKPFVSANDGGSGVAWLMELGHHMAAAKLNVGVDFVFFDGEEYVFDPRPGVDVYFFGSRHFAAEYSRQRPRHRYVAAVLLDLFAGTDARYPFEQNSLFQAGALAHEVWEVARELNEPIFERRIGPSVLDDHLALNQAGIPAIDIIDFDYVHWHRLSDTPDKCSPATMTKVARVLSTWLQRVK
jgi:glutaminyl-peptide cyclotransferase